MADTAAMSNDAWRDRLKAALNASGRSMRSVSLDAGLGSGYLHSVLVEGKDPTIGRLLDVCSAIGASPSFILYGVDLMPEDAEIIEAMHASPDARAAIVALLRTRQTS